MRHTDDKNEQLLRIIRNVGGSGIVYVRTREGAEQVAAFLRDEGISAEYYHGGLGHAERSMRQEAWISGRTPSWSLPMPSGWGSTSPTSATWYIIRCATHSKATIRRPDVPDATGDAAMPYC